MSALDKLNPDKNGLTLVPKEITSSTLTTRLKGICKINRLIEHCNDLCNSFTDVDAQDKYQESTNKFREWILQNKIIEHIFGPNCHVEIIKQSHTIINFVAYSLNDEHVNVIWSASLLKHCGRQVLDLLTSLIRFMRAGPVLHLYWLVRNLNIEDHSEHTLLLISHILRFIWSHSPCINQIQFCNIQKNRQPLGTDGQIVEDPDSKSKHVQTLIQQHNTIKHEMFPPHSQTTDQTHPPRDISSTHKQRSVQVIESANCEETSPKEETINTLNTNVNNFSGPSTAKAYASLANADEHYQWLASCIFPSDNTDDVTERPASSRSTTSESVDLDKDLQQSLLDAIKGVTQHQNLQQTRTQGSGVSTNETLAKGGGDGREPADDVNQNVVSHILKSISADSNQSTSQLMQSSVENEALICEVQQAHCNFDAENYGQEWLKQMKNNEFLDNTSDVSACCSEDKNMGDFDDDAQEYIQNDNSNEGDEPRTSSNEIFSHEFDSTKNDVMSSGTSRSANGNNFTRNEIFDSTSTSRDSESKFRLSLDQNPEQFIKLPLESVAHFKELKKASYGLSNVTSELTSDDDSKELSEYNLVNLSDPGKTLLWDLLQDGKIEQLAPNLHLEVETVLVNLVMSFGDRYIRYKFIEACLENLSMGTSVIISLRLLPKLMSFNTITRNLSIPAMNETHTIVLWAEREYNMSQNFFKNLVEYYSQRQYLLAKLECISSDAASTHSNEQLRLLEEYGELDSKNPIFTHIDKIITRMSFLTFIYSKPFSPEVMKLNQEQMDQLWDCLASDTNLRCSDVLFQWIYQQAVGDDFHGVNDELLDYVLKKKMPTLAPEQFRLRGLKLLEQLLWIRQDYECCHGLEHPATKLLWDVGLKASDDEVSMAAIRILNHFYIYTNHQKSTKCDKGINFMRYCMNHLKSCLNCLTSADDPGKINQLLDVLQKVILLIRTHLEVFKAHWSYYLRILQSNNEADLISHRLNAYEIKLTLSTRLICQAASSMDKTTIEVQSNDFVGELRAEIVKWWYTHVDRTYFEQSASPTSSTNSSSASAPISSTSARPYDKGQPKQLSEPNSSSRETSNSDSSNKLGSFTEFLLSNHHSLRLLSHNQEIPFEWDERQINELDFKDMQVIYVLNDVKAPNVDSADDSASEKSNESSQVTYMPKTEIPSLLLLRYEYFECLMEADRFLGSFQSKNADLSSRAKTLSRRVWEIIQILPTCPHYREDLKRCGSAEYICRLKSSTCSGLLSADCPQRLLYSLQIIDILKSSPENPNWGSIFIRKGGLADIFDVFMSQKLLPEANEDWNEWLQECLAYLLKLLFQFGTKSVPPVLSNESSSSSSSSRMSTSLGSNRTIMSSASSIKRARRNRGRLLAVGEDRVPIPLLSEELLKLLSDTDLIFSKLIKILTSSAHCKSQGDQYYYVSMSSRAMIVHHVMSFLASWCKSDPKFPKFQIADHCQLLKALILDDTDSSTRREACNGFFKLHHACSSKLTNLSVDSINSTLNSSLDSSGDAILAGSNFELSSWNFSAELLKCLIKFLPIAEAMKPPKPIRNYVSENDYIKELNSPGCKDYFWLTSRLIDSQAATTLKINDKASGSSQSKTTSDDIAPDEREFENSPDNQRKAQTLAEYSTINLYDLCEYLVIAIRKRHTYETRDFSVEDDTLRGMLHMMMMALRQDSTFRYTDTAFEFVHELYDYLFAPPTQGRRYLPKCKSPATRSTAFDLMIALVEKCPKNYFGLLELLLVDQHNSVVKISYPTDYWPHDDCRSEVGFVGLINLGATCYLATCMQHLFMIPNLRYAILSIEDTKNIRHGEIIRELQKIFAFMLESERKAYNPRNFCKVYTMDNHPLNIAEQTDMTEFLTDLITKLEESSLELRQIIKGLFSGTLSNNVVSLDCPHISRTTEEFYTLRVQVADMRNLNDALDELTVKDTLEGDNMYTCSTCEKKVRAEKRACIVKLPRILCFNTMRYTFNMATMTKEKVNTHFSFPLKLDMADYLETNLMKRQQSSNVGSSYSSKSSISGSSSPTGCAKGEDNEDNQKNSCDSEAVLGGIGSDKAATKKCSSERSSPDKDSKLDDPDEEESDTMFELIGVTVHTGNADGGHYYCFIRDCEDQSTDKPRWYLFNDAEVKPFDDSHIGTECYGGELTTKSYDAINDRFMDFSIEKTNSAYMLFYKRVDYKYRSRSVASRYLESDTQRNSPPSTSSSPSSDETCESRANSSDASVDVELAASERCARAAELIQIASEMNKAAGSSCSRLGDSRPGNIVELNFDELCQRTYEDFRLPRYLANWIWSDNMKFVRDKNVFEHNYFNFMWQICANLPRTLNQVPEHLSREHHYQASDDAIAIRTVHLAIAFVLGVLMNSRERPNLSNWTELIRKQFNSSKAACDWLMHLIDDEETWLKQLLLKCPIEMVRQLFQRLCNDLNGSKQHKKLRLIK